MYVNLEQYCTQSFKLNWKWLSIEKTRPFLLSNMSSLIRDRDIFDLSLLEIQQFPFAFHYKTTWNYVFEATNCRQMIFFLLEELLYINRYLVSSRNGL